MVQWCQVASEASTPPSSPSQRGKSRWLRGGTVSRSCQVPAGGVPSVEKWWKLWIYMWHMWYLPMVFVDMINLTMIKIYLWYICRHDSFIYDRNLMCIYNYIYIWFIYFNNGWGFIIDIWWCSEYIPWLRTDIYHILYSMIDRYTMTTFDSASNEGVFWEGIQWMNQASSTLDPIENPHS